jgi:polar amino acid transport system substrate-binding protein
MSALSRSTRNAGTWLLLLAGGAAAAGAQDLAEIEKRGTLRVAVSEHAWPERFAFDPRLEPGLEKEILLGFASLHKLKLEVVAVPGGADRIPYLVAGKADVATGLIVTESRRKTVNFTSEVLPARHVVLNRRPAAPIVSLEELRSKRIGTYKGSSWAEEIVAAGVPSANVDSSFKDGDEVVEALSAGRVPVAVMSAIWASLAQKRDPELQMGMVLGAPTSVAYGVRKDAPHLFTALDEYVGNVRRSATWSRLVVKYFGNRSLEILKRCRAD